MTRFIGIDPGSRRTGYGLIEVVDRRMSYVTSGIIQTRGQEFLDRLGEIFADIDKVLLESEAAAVALEQVFVGKNLNTAIKLGQARGVVLASAMSHGMQIYEYAPRRIKLAVTGTGTASKSWVQKMVASILFLDFVPPEDSADALAAAICHVHERGLAG